MPIGGGSVREAAGASAIGQRLASARTTRHHTTRPGVGSGEPPPSLSRHQKPRLFAQTPVRPLRRPSREECGHGVRLVSCHFHVIGKVHQVPAVR